MVNITRVDIIPGLSGDGIKVMDFEVGCAKVTEMEVDGTSTDTLTHELMEEHGFVCGWGVNDPSEEEPIKFSDSILTGNNYVLVLITKNDEGNKEVTVIANADDLCGIFGLSQEDADMLNNYIGALATDRQLLMNKTSEEDGVMFFTNMVDAEFTKDYLSDDKETMAARLNNLRSSSSYMSEYMSHNFIKTFLLTLVNACQDRYNKVHRDDTLRAIATAMGEITYWNDGQLCKPTVLDIENFINDIKGVITIQ